MSCVASLSGLSVVLFVFVLCLVLPVYLDCPLFCLSSSYCKHKSQNEDQQHNGQSR
jgi:hypothetical protein